MSELSERYESEIVRLRGLIEEHVRDRKKVRVFLWALVLAPFGFFVHPVVAGGIAFVALSLYFTGLYLSSMHYWDRTEQLRRTTRELAKLRASEGEEKAAPPADSPAK